MPRFNFAMICLVFACLAGCGKGKPAPPAEGAVDAKDPLPADAVDKIFVFAVGESKDMAAGGAMWMLEASRDKEGAWITSGAEWDKSVAGEFVDTRKPGTKVDAPTRYPLTDAEWKGLLDFARETNLLRWRPRETKVIGGGESFMTIRTVVDFRYRWSMGLGQDEKASRLELRLRDLFNRHERAVRQEPR